MSRVAHRVFAACLGLACFAGATSAAADDTFVQIDSVERGVDDDGHAFLAVTGTLAGQSALESKRYLSTAWGNASQFEPPLTECRRMLMLSLARPGRFAVTIKGNEWNVSSCVLKAR